MLLIARGDSLPNWTAPCSSSPSICLRISRSPELSHGRKQIGGEGRVRGLFLNVAMTEIPLIQPIGQRRQLNMPTQPERLRRFRGRRGTVHAINYNHKTLFAKQSHETWRCPASSQSKLLSRTSRIALTKTACHTAVENCELEQHSDESRAGAKEPKDRPNRDASGRTVSPASRGGHRSARSPEWLSFAKKLLKNE